MPLYYLKLYLITLFGFFAIDMFWLGLVARKFYRDQLGFLLADKPNWIAAFVFYALFVAGLLVFAIVPALQANSWKKLIVLSAFFGLITYATYDLTNMATVKNWPWMVTAVDLVWGVVLALSVSCIGFQAGRWLNP